MVSQTHDDVKLSLTDLGINYVGAMLAILVNNERKGAEKLYVGNVPIPDPQERQVLVKAFGLNRMDILQREGQYPVPPGASDILGVEFSGTIDKLGSDSGTWSVGDEVFGLATGGAYAEYIAIGVEFILPKPRAMSWEVAASIMENYVTAFQSLVVIGLLKENENVLIHTGASGTLKGPPLENGHTDIVSKGVGTAALQIANSYGVKNIFTTASSAEKLEFLQTLIANPNLLHTINYKTRDFEKEIKEVTNGRGVDVLIDFVGKSHWDRNLAALALDGRMVMLGLLSGMDLEKTSIAPILFKRLHIIGSTLRSRSPAYQGELVQRFGKEIFPLIADERFGEQMRDNKGGKAIQVVIHAVYPIEEIVKAHQDMESDKSIGKIVVAVP
ncbi:hypothetical protein FRC17_000096 [Serendipita sp. 399]|nr:hypothetical protein FRC17_000096 [Serendipita sp. 399]